MRDRSEPRIRTLQELVALLEDRGGRDAVVALGDEANERWDDDRLHAEAARFASGLLRAGCSGGDRIGICAPNRPAWLAVCLGSLRAGAVVVPVDVQFGDRNLTHVLDDCRPRWLAVNADQARRIAGLELASRPELILLDDEQDERSWRRIASAERETPPELDAHDEAVLFYTSGTTGPPKGVGLTHANLVHQLNELAARRFVTPEDRVMLPLPLHHVYPFAIGMLLPLFVGVPLVFPAGMTGPGIVRALHEGEISVIIGVPRLYRTMYDGLTGRIASSPWPVRLVLRPLLGLSLLLRRRLGLRAGGALLRPLRRRFGPRLRLLASGGSPLDPELAYGLEALGWRVVVGYGLTETSPLVTMIPPGEGGFTTVGRPIGDVEVRLGPLEEASADASEPAPDRETDDEETGEVQVRGPNVFGGYLGAPEATAEAFTDDGWFRTGDRGRFDAEGRLVVSGRVSTMIVTEGGENVQPREVESHYESHPLIREAGVLAHDDRLAAVVVPEVREIQRAADGDAREAVRRAVDEQSRALPSYQRLADFVVSRGAIPRTRLGDIQRHRLRELFDQEKRRAAGEGSPERPVDIEAMSAEDRDLLADPTAREVWEWLADRHADIRLTPDTSPQLDLGVDSLEWFDVSLEIRRRTGVELTEEAISGIETVRDLLRAVAERGERETAGDLNAPLEDPGSVLDDAQMQWIRAPGPAMGLLARCLLLLDRLVLKLCFRYRVEGVENLPGRGPCILAPNHRSLLDAPLVAAALGYSRLRSCRWAGAADIMLANPLLRLVARLAGVAPVDSRRSAISSLAFGSLILQRNHDLVWFPEGRMSRDGRLQRFQPGIGMLSEHFDVAVVPVWIEGTEAALPPGRFWPRPHRVSVRFGAPVAAEALAARGEGDRAHQRITDGLRKEMIELGTAE